MVREGYKLTEVGVIPKGWKVLLVGDAFEVKNNLRLPISKKVRKQMEGSYPYYGPTGVQGYINEYRVQGEHALIGEDGDHFLKWRDASMTLIVNGKFNVNNHAHIIKGKKNLTCWFFWFFAHRDITPYLTRQGAGRFKLNKSSLISIPCALPTIQEQNAIAQALSDVDGLIDGLQKLIAKKQDIKTAAMQQLLTGKTRLPGFGEGMGYQQTELGEIPEDWRTSLLGNLSTFIGSGKSMTSGPKGGFPLYGSTGIIGSTNTPMYQSEAILVARVGENAGKLNKVSGKYGVSDNTIILRLGSQSYQDFYYYQLTNTTFDNLTFGSGQPLITGTQIKNFRVYSPKLIEQRAIAQVFSDMDEELDALQSRLSKTKAIKQGMMQELLTGRTRLI